MSEVRTINWYGCIKEKINDYIKTNNKRSITGKRLNELLNDMVAAISGGMLFGGEVTPTDTKDATGDTPVFYYASEAGTYTNLGNITVAEGELAFIYHDTNAAWHKMSWNLTTLFDGKVDTVEGKGLSKNDYTDEDKGKIDALPLPIDVNDVGKVLVVGKNGLEWKSITDGKSAREIYNELFNTNLDDAGFIAALKQNYPMKYIDYDSIAAGQTVGIGFDNINGLAASASTAEIMWFMPNDDNTATQLFITVQIEASTYKWYKLGVVNVPSNVITKDDIDNKCLNGAADKPASSSVVSRLNASLNGFLIDEDKVTIIESGEGQNVFNGYINGNTGAYTSSSNNSFIIVPINNARRLRWLAKENVSNTAYIGYAFGTFNDDIDAELTHFVPIQFAYYGNNSEGNKAVEYVKDVPEGATHAVITIWRYQQGTTSAVTLDNFYCYKENGSVVKEEIGKVSSKVADVSFTEEKINDYKIYVGSVYLGYNDSPRIIVRTSDKYRYTIINVEGVKSVRFMGCTALASDYPNYRGWAFFDASNYDPDTEEANDDGFRCDNTGYISFGGYDVGVRGKKEYIVDVPEGAVYMKISCQVSFAEIVLTTNDFYIYLQRGEKTSKMLQPKISGKDTEGLWRWKKNLININDLKNGYISGGEIVLTTYPQSLMSNKLHLEDGVKYAAQNIQLGQSSGAWYVYVYRFTANDEYIDSASYPAEVTSTLVAPGKTTGRAIFKYKKSNVEGMEEAYQRVRLRNRAIPSEETFNDWKNAQIEVGAQYTEIVPYRSERIFEVYNKEMLDNLLMVDAEVTPDHVFDNGTGVYMHYNSTSGKGIQVGDTIESAENVLDGHGYGNSTSWNVVRYVVNPQQSFTGKTVATEGITGVKIYYWADADKKCIAIESYKYSGTNVIVADLIAPTGAAYLYVQVRATNANQQSLKTKQLVTLEQIFSTFIKDYKPKIKIKALFIGDSFMLNAASYPSIIMDNMDNGIELVTGIVYEGANSNYNPALGSLQAFLTYLTTNSSKLLEYDKYSKGNFSTSTKTLPDILRDESWDYVIIRANTGTGITTDGDVYIGANGAAVYVNGYGDNYDYNNVIDMLRDAVIQQVNKPVKFGCLLPEKSPKNDFDEIFDEATMVNKLDADLGENINAAQKYMQFSMFDFVLPCGTALQNARHISELNKFGDAISYSGNLTGAGFMDCDDGHHLQEGVGKEILGYAICLKLLESYFKSIFGDETVFNVLMVNSYAIPHKHGSSCGFKNAVEGDSDERISNINEYNKRLLSIIQKCAYYAVKDPFNVNENMSKICAADISELNRLAELLDN